MSLYLLDYGAGNVRSLANSLTKLGYEFTWISSPDDFKKASKLIFPGVGAFQTAIGNLKAKGLFEPLKEYIASGRPYFGICIGLHVLFASSEENPDHLGFNIIPAPIEQFDNTTKSVPHMGWNAVQFTDSKEGLPEGIDESSHYYFVHSYRAKYDPTNEEAARWVHTTCQYGQEIFVSSVRKGNVFGTQFHPEKSGEAGLRILDAWLRKTEEGGDNLISEPPRPIVYRKPKAQDGLTKRLIACMDVRANDDGDLVVTKGDQYDVREKLVTPSTSTATSSSSADRTDLKTKTAGAVRNLGKPVSLSQRYYASGADEIALLNITSFRHSPLHDQPMLAVVRAAAQEVFVPLTIGGGIKDTVDPDGTKRSALEVAGEYFRAGADKVSLASDAVYAVEKLLARGAERRRKRRREVEEKGGGEGEGGCMDVGVCSEMDIGKELEMAMEKGDGTSAIEQIAAAYGKQAVVVSIDPKRVYVDIPPPSSSTSTSASNSASTSTSNPNTSPPPSLFYPSEETPYHPSELIHGSPNTPDAGKSWWYQAYVSGGRTPRPLSVLYLSKGSELLGAGELMLNSIDRDGTGKGFDLELINLVKKAVRIPVVASSGAGSAQHFKQVFEETGVEAALAAGIFHRGEVGIGEVKKLMKDAGIPTRS